MGAIDTKDRLLDAAEMLFAQRGYRGASLRGITAAAEVNLAAVNYHFGSKEDLLRAVILRRIHQVNGERLARLDELEGRGGTPDLEEVVAVFVGPAMDLAADRRVGASFMRVVARVHGETEGPWRRVLDSGAFDEVQSRFLAVLARLLPDLSPRDLIWRLHLMVGAMVQTLLHAETLRDLSGGLCDPTDPQVALAQLVPFLAGGLRAPVPTLPPAH